MTLNNTLSLKHPIMGSFLEKYSLPERPNDLIPYIPSYLDDMPDDKLMLLYAEFMAWMSYSKADMVLAEISEEQKETALRFCEAKILILQWGDGSKNDTVTLAKARRDVDPEVLLLQKEYMESRAYRKLVNSVFERCERGSQVVSRELSRRISLAPLERKNSSYYK